MPLCPDGHEVPADASFCTTCGARVQTTAQASTPLTTGSPAPSEPPAAPYAAPARYAPPPQAAQAVPPAQYAPPQAAPAAPATQYAPPAQQAGPVAHQTPIGYAGPAAPQGPAGPHQVPPASGTGMPYRFQLRRLAVIDQIIAGACVVLFISLWLPWFGVEGDYVDASLGGINAHSYLSFAVLTTVGLIAYLALRAGWDRLPFRLPIAHAPLLLVVGLVQLLLVLIAFLVTPDGFEHEAGAWIALIAALGASLPIVVPAVQASQRR